MKYLAREGLNSLRGRSPQPGPSANVRQNVVPQGKLYYVGLHLNNNVIKLLYKPIIISPTKIEHSEIKM